MKENYSRFPWVQLPSWQNKAGTLPPWEWSRSGGPTPWRSPAPPRRARPCRASPWHQERFLQQRRFIDLRSLPVTGQSRPCTGSMLVWLDLLEVDRGCGPVQPKSELWKSHHSGLFSDSQQYCFFLRILNGSICLHGCFYSIWKEIFLSKKNT